VLPRQCYLEDELVYAYWDRSHHDRIEDLIVAFIFCAANIDNFPFQVYGSEQLSHGPVYTFLQRSDALECNFELKRV
jgi:hypothetical protein